MPKVKFFQQLDSADCGPTCLKMIAYYYGKNIDLTLLREKSYIDRTGVNLKGISEAAESIGFKTLAVKIPVFKSKTDSALINAPLPAILHWNQNHFVVLVKLTKKYAWIVDPERGEYKLTIPLFEKSWVSDVDKGIALLLEPTVRFHEQKNSAVGKKGISFFFSYLKPHKRLIFQLIIGLFLGTLFQLLFPFLTQSLVDIGIDSQNLQFVYIILIGQLILFFSSIITRFIQSWILLHISVRINVGLVSDFLLKLMNLPLGFFDSKNTGDLLQRIGDHSRIERFLTNSSLNFVLSVSNLFVFGVVLAIYNLKIFTVFLLSSILYLVWIFIFLKMRKDVDYVAFSQYSENNTALIEIIQGMAEIKLQGSHLKRRWSWSDVQSRLFKTQMKALKIAQYQDAGAFSIMQLKDILITFFAATLVIEGKMTLGMMLAVQYIMGQLNAPLQQLVAFIRSGQDSNISLERLSEIHSMEPEETPDVRKKAIIPDGDIHIKNVSFQYTPITPFVLKNINLVIPRGKTTAIVGMSGSGKTTLIKLLLGFYPPSEGSIQIGTTNLSAIYRKRWREACGVVMQDGYIFSDTIASNISESDDIIDMEKVVYAASMANIDDYINGLPMGYNTMIGEKGSGISAGQRQRIFISRAIYKDPLIIFLDEATNSLDANNEKIIMDNFRNYTKNKTAIIVAHRLSTVKNADQIIVLDKGEISEMGSHKELIKSKGQYYELIKNQLELGL